MSLSVNLFPEGKEEASKFPTTFCVSLDRFTYPRPSSLMHSATNVRLGRREDRPLLYVSSIPSKIYVNVEPFTELESTQLQMSSVSGVMNAWVGTITR
jgi:hypothetical protein